MSQHLVDSGQRISAARQELRTNGVHNGTTGNGEGNVSAIRRAGGNGQTDAGDAGSADATLRALDALSDALDEMSNDHKLLETRLRDLHRQRSEGKAWREILAEEDPPGTMQLVSRMLACLAKASGTLRKELVDTLRREGVSIPAIAKLFGVTHQRVSNLLRRPSD